MTDEIDVPLEALLRVRELHESVDGSASRVAASLGARLRCGLGCSDCCVDELTVTTAEAASIAEAFPDVLASEPRAPGACAMLDGRGACRVYAARPYVCRTQGLPLRWIDEDAGVERRDICPKNEAPASRGEAAPLEALSPASCWTLGRAEAALAAIDRLAGGDAARVRLRDLFVAGDRERLEATTPCEPSGEVGAKTPKTGVDCANDEVDENRSCANSAPE